MRAVKATTRRRKTVNPRAEEEVVFDTPLKARPKVVKVEPQTEAQRRYASSLDANHITFATGPAGTGKTWLATAKIACMLRDNQIESFCITRPAVEAEEELGFLPGDLTEKYAPYLAPVRQVLEEILGASVVEYMLKVKRIVPMPLAFMRGVTFKNAVVLLDEAQNTTPNQMKMFLTRLGSGSRLVINGDATQKDIPGPCGLEDGIRRIGDLKGVGVVRFERSDIVRHDMCQAIVERYEVTS